MLMTNYALLILGIILINLACYHYYPVEYRVIYNTVGIITIVPSIIWDRC